ncbi:uncharacterized protein LOC141863312 isoform X2 [Acropora palmata]|uniref:uncharacterized protein LOC141863312 isoform X2 n=1 Tax=Acropora palmata TaxID=6131 RepID=UPI003DA0C334
MAGDSNNNIVQQTRHLHGSNSQEKGSSYPWEEEIKTARDFQTRNGILERRSLEIRSLYEHCQESDEHRTLKEEWFALVKEKDRNFRQQLEKENEEAKSIQMKQLFHLLESLGTFSFDKPNEIILKRNMAKMYQQVGKYCRRNKVDLKNKTSDLEKPRDTQREDLITKPLLVEIPIPPPPPPPSVLTSHPSNAIPTQKVCDNEARKRSIKTTNTRTPRNPNQDLLNQIRKRCRSELKSTPFKRSPGGTPLKRPRRMSETATSDLIEVALKRKFKNVRFQSPHDNNSPNSMTSPTSILKK